MCTASLIRTLTVGIGISPIQRRETAARSLSLPVGIRTLPRSFDIITLNYALRNRENRGQSENQSEKLALTRSRVPFSLSKSTLPSGLTEVDSTVAQP